MEIERIIVRMFADASQYNRAMDRAEFRLVTMVGRMNNLGRAFEVPILAATGAITAFGLAAGAAAINAFQLAASYEASAVSLEVMAGSATKGKMLLDDITKMAIATPFKTPELLSGAGQLAAFGIEAEQIIPTLKVLGDVSGGVGLERLPNLILAYGQVKSAGRLMGQELRQFINANVPLIEYLAKIMNVPQTAIKGMVERAEVGFPQVQKAFNMMVREGGLYFGMLERRAQTVEGRWSAFVETIQVVLRNVGLAFFDTFGVRDLLNDWSNAIGTDGAGIREFFVKVKGYVDFLTTAVRGFTNFVDRNARSLGSWVKEQDKLIDSLTKIGKTLLVLGAIYVSVQALIGAWSLLGSAIALMGTPVGLLVVTLGSLLVILERLGALDGFGDTFLSGFSKISDQFTGFGKGITDAIMAEDWALVGRIIGKGIEIGFMTFIRSLGAEIAGVFFGAISAVLTYAERQLKIEMAELIYAKDSYFSSKNNEVLVKEYQDRVSKANREVEEQRKKDQNIIKGIQTELISGLSQYDGVIGGMAQQAEKARTAKEYTDRLASNPTFAMLEGLNKDIDANYQKAVVKVDWAKLTEAEAKKLENEIADRFSDAGSHTINRMIVPAAATIAYDLARAGGATPESMRAFSVANAKIEENTRWFSQNFDSLVNTATKGLVDALTPGRAGHETVNAGMAILKGIHVGLAQEIWSQELGLTPKGGVGGPAQVAVLPSVSAQAIKMADQIKKEMSEGVWAGNLVDKFGLFQRNMSLMEEAHGGPGGKFGWPFKGVGSVINDKEYEFGLVEEFSNLKKYIGVRDVKMPGVAMRGSQEAQDAVNREQLEIKNVQEEVRNVLLQAKIIQEQTRDYNRQIVEELKRLNAQEGDWGGGGDF